MRALVITGVLLGCTHDEPHRVSNTPHAVSVAARPPPVSRRDASADQRVAAEPRDPPAATPSAADPRDAPATADPRDKPATVAVTDPSDAPAAFAAADPRDAPAAADPRDATRRAAHAVLVEYCGSCHEGHRPTAKPAALAIFDLDQPDWPARFDDHRFASALGRLAKKSPAARAAFVAFRDAELAAR
jgi:hypothetical protein